jgi:hypothetical protein
MHCDLMRDARHRRPALNKIKKVDALLGISVRIAVIATGGYWYPALLARVPTSRRKPRSVRGMTVRRYAAMPISGMTEPCGEASQVAGEVTPKVAPVPDSEVNASSLGIGECDDETSPRHARREAASIPRRTRAPRGRTVSGLTRLSTPTGRRRCLNGH